MLQLTLNQICFILYPELLLNLMEYVLYIHIVKGLANGTNLRC